MEKDLFFKMKKRTKTVNRDSFASLPEGPSKFTCEAFFTDEFEFTGQEGTWIGIVALHDGKAYRFGANAFFNALGLYSANEKNQFEEDFGEVGFTNTVTVSDEGKVWEEADADAIGHSIEEEEEEEEVKPKKSTRKKD